MNYYETMGSFGNDVPTTIGHLDAQINEDLAGILSTDSDLARGYLRAQVDPQAEAAQRNLAWFASMAELGLLTADQLNGASQTPGFSIIRAAVNIDGLRR